MRRAPVRPFQLRMHRQSPQETQQYMTALAPESFHEQLLSRRYEPNVAAVNELCDSLQETRPGTVVPYVDPMHDVEECRIISLFSNIG